MTISSNFNQNAEGWTASNGTEQYDPAGFISGSEGGNGVWTFVAPNAYLGDLSTYYGGTISFDMSQPTGSAQFDDEDVIITGGGLTLAVDAGDNPGTTFTSYSVDLEFGGGWKLNSVNGTVATEAEIRQVLANVESLEIRGEFVIGTSGDASSLDNVRVEFGDVAQSTTGAGFVSSDFEGGLQGWTIINDARDVLYVPTGGNPGGHMRATDVTSGATWYFSAPAAYLGDKSAFFGGTLSFDLIQVDLGNQYDEADVRIVGNNGDEISFHDFANPGLDWTPYSVILDTSANWLLGESENGPVATEAEIRAVLDNVEALYIRGEFVLGSDEGGLDNVRLAALAAVARYADGSFSSFEGNFATLQDALVGIANGAGLRVLGALTETAPVTITAENLTIEAEAGYEQDLVLGSGVANLELSGAGSMDVTGNALANTIGGNGGDNLIDGLGGDDTLYGRGGNDSVNGGDGNDSLFGGAGNDRMTGGANFDTIFAGEGNDTVFGGDGRDLVFLNQGNDLFNDNGQGGELGLDTVFTGLGDDTIEGGNGDDVFYGEGGNDVINGRLGNDLIFGGANFDTISAGEGNDTVEGGDGRDLVSLNEGNDLFNDNGQGGELGRDTVLGGTGNDTIQGGNGDDEFFGEDGADLIFARLGNDTVGGGAGNDTLNGGDGDDSLLGGDADDSLLGDTGNDTIDGGAGRDTIDGGDGNDRILAGGGDDSIIGNLGNDIIFTGGGNDTVSGGAGNDTINDTGAGSADTFFGEDGADVLLGGDGDDRLLGGAGNDTVNAGDGADTISGGGGSDRLTGGTGADTFAFDAVDASSGTDLMGSVPVGGRMTP